MKQAIPITDHLKEGCLHHLHSFPKNLIAWFTGEPAGSELLCFGLVKNHAMMDGNKRLGVHVMLVFLTMNGYELSYSQTELSDIILSVASGEAGAEDILQWILKHQS